MDAQDHANGLRELADWIEEHADIISGSDFSNPPALLLCRLNPDAFVAAAQALGVEQSEVSIKSGYLNVSRAFGPFRAEVFIEADEVGESTTQMRPTTEWTINPEIRDALGTKAVL